MQHDLAISDEVHVQPHRGGGQQDARRFEAGPDGTKQVTAILVGHTSGAMSVINEHDQ